MFNSKLLVYQRVAEIHHLHFFWKLKHSLELGCPITTQTHPGLVNVPTLGDFVSITFKSLLEMKYPPYLGDVQLGNSAIPKKVRESGMRHPKNGGFSSSKHRGFRWI